MYVVYKANVRGLFSSLFFHTGVSPRYREEWAPVQEQRVEQYTYVKRAIATLCGRHPHLAANDALTPELLVKMCLLTHKVDVHTVLSVWRDACVTASFFFFFFASAVLYPRMSSLRMCNYLTKRRNPDAFFLPL